MSSVAIASVVFGCSFGAALIGMVLHVKLPDHHLDGDSRDVVKLVMGLIATMAALVLSLLIASANSSYDRQSSELKTLSTNILLLDRALKFYGTGAKEARDGLRQAIVQISEFPTGDFGSNRQAVSVETDRPFRSKAAPRCGWVLVPTLANRRCVIHPILLWSAKAS